MADSRSRTRSRATADDLIASQSHGGAALDGDLVTPGWARPLGGTEARRLSAASAPRQRSFSLLMHRGRVGDADDRTLAGLQSSDGLNCTCVTSPSIVDSTGPIDSRSDSAAVERRHRLAGRSSKRHARPARRQRRSEARAAGELACRPGSVHPLARAGGHPSRTAVAGSLVRSTREHRAGRPRSLAQARRRLRRPALLTLLRVGFTEPPQSPAALVVSYTTVSPLPPAPGRDPEPAAVCFLWHFPAGHPGSALPTTLPFGARTFLGGPGEPGPTRPPGQLARR